jgi:predicted phosphodiesterase
MRRGVESVLSEVSANHAAFDSMNLQSKSRIGRPTSMSAALVKGALTTYGDRWPSRSIGAILFEKNPEHFTSAEAAYKHVRYYRGQNGSSNRKDLKDRRFIKAAAKHDDWIIPLPDPITRNQPWDVFRLTFNRGLILQDLHVPFHDRKAIELAVGEGIRKGVDCVILNGDVGDFYGLSQWEKDPTMRDSAEEIQTIRLLLEYLRERFPKARIVYKEGNHEERIWRNLWKKCPELYAMKDGAGKPLVSLDSLIDADFYGIETVMDKRPILVGPHLHVLHGHEFPSRIDKAVNTARGLFLRARCNAFCGHTHNTSNHVDVGLERTVSTWSGGCLCDLHPVYMPINSWNTGFAMVDLSKEQWAVHNKKIINGCIA